VLNSIAAKTCNFLKNKHTSLHIYVAAVRTRTVKISHTQAKHVK